MRGKEGSAIVTIAIGLFLVLAVFPMVSHSADLGEAVKYVPHAPIRIDSNADFDEAHGVVNWATGNGSTGNPWIIEGWDINGSVLGYCLFIGNTTDYFVVKDCYLHKATGFSGWPYFENSGIHLYHVNNGRVDKNTAESNDYSGLFLYYSNYNNITNNSIYDNIWGIDSAASNNNTYVGNDIYQNSQGLTLSLTGASIGSNYNKVINNNVTNNIYGITVDDSSYNTIENNNASWNENRGIRIEGSFYNTIRWNNASNIGKATDDSGISILFADNNIVTNNTLLNNYQGISIRYSANNTLKNNTMIGGGIYIFSHSFVGEAFYEYNSHTIDLSNTINNKPVYYWKNRTSGVVPSEAGQIILANCSNVTIENFNNQDVYCGIIVGFSENVTIANNTATKSGDGIQLTSSKYCKVQNNTISETVYFGLHLFESNRNEISNNSFISNLYRGLYSANTYNNSIHNNNLENNAGYGFYFTTPGLIESNNRIFHNNFINTTNKDRSGNFWNLSYPGGGNYWSNYTGVDEKRGPGQDQPGNDGLGDTNYSIEGEGGCFDEYPLMMPFEFDFVNHNYSLSEGWNLISLPAIQGDESLDNVLDSITGKWDCIQAYGSINGIWQSNITTRPDSQNDLDAINHKMGFWINIIEPDVNLTVRGHIPTSTSINLYAGWNLVGYPTMSTETVANALWGTGADRVEVFDPAEPYRIREVGPTYLMKPGEGYWVHVPMDTVWIVDW